MLQTDLRKNKVIKLVGQIARSYGYRLQIDDSDPTTMGYVTPSDRTLHLSTHVRYGDSKSKLEEVGIEHMEDTALHELAHIFQFARKDRRMTKKIEGRTIFEWDQLVITGAPVSRVIRRRILKDLYAVELEAELYSLDMRRRMGLLKDPSRQVRRTVRTLMEYVLRLHFDIHLTSIEVKKFFNTTDIRLTKRVPSLEEMVAAIEPKTTHLTNLHT